MFLRYAEYLFFAMALVFLITQVIVPAIRGQRLFPLFGRQRKLEGELAEQTQHNVEAQLEKEIAEGEKTAARTRSQTAKSRNEEPTDGDNRG